MMWGIVKTKWETFWYTPTHAFNLGFSRFVIFAWTLYVSWGWDFSTWGEVPPELFSPLQYMKVIGFPLLTTSSLVQIQIVWRISLFFATIGFFSQISGFVSAVLTVYLYTLDDGFTQASHVSIPLFFAMLVLALSRSGDSFSVDSLIKGAKGRSSAVGPSYSWPMVFMSAFYLLMFSASAISKARNSGLAWGWYTLEDYLCRYRILFLDSSPPDLFRVRNIDFILTYLPVGLMGVGAHLLELLAPLALIKGVVRIAVLMSLILLQIGIFITMGPDFRATISFTVFFVPWFEVKSFVLERFIGKVNAK